MHEIDKYIWQRNGQGVYYYRRRVPVDLQKYLGDRLIRLSLKTEELPLARKRAEIKNDSMEKFWADVLKNPKINATEEYKDAVATARARGFAYKTVGELADVPLQELVDRMMAIRVAKKEGRGKAVAKALSGVVDHPILYLSECVNIFFDQVRSRFVDKKKGYIKRFKGDHERAMSYFIEALGDMDVQDLRREHILQYRSWWINRVAEMGLNSNTANKNIIKVKAVLKEVALAENIKINLREMFLDVKLQEKNRSRASFEAEFVQNKILLSGVLNELNTEARAVVYIMADTGARLGEVVGLVPADIFLDDDIPHIWIQENEKRGLKTGPSERKVPLVGYALEGAKMIADTGVTRYANGDSVSSLISQFLKEKNLKPTKRHALYSLRHTFKDRLRDVEAPEEIIDNLMGHSTRGPKYGRGHLLSTKLKWMEKIAFKVG